MRPRQRRYDPVPATRKHGLSPEEQAALLASQGHGCAICGTYDPGPGGWHIDHDHAEAKKHSHPQDRGCRYCIRGILCRSCNIMLGNARDSAPILEAGARYIARRGRLGA